MKRALALFLIPLSFACSERATENWESFEVSIDTVFVDAGDELIFHQIGLSHSDLSNDQKQLFNFTPKGELEVIDLDSLKLVNKIVMEREGPLGTGEPYTIQIDQTGSLALLGFNEVRVFNSDLSSMNRYQLSAETLSKLNPEDILSYNTILSSDGKFLYSIYENTERIPQGLARISFDQMQVEKIPIELAGRIQPLFIPFF